MAYASWSGPARTLALAIDDAVGAARAGNAAAFEDALLAFGRHDPAVLGVLLAAVLQDVLERSHPDGLDAEDAEQVLASCARNDAWFARLDQDVLARALLGALGVGDPADDPAGAAALLAHGVLLIANLLDGMGTALEPVLDDALRELHRAQTVEMP